MYYCVMYSEDKYLTQSGFGLFTILLAAVLFAALTYAISNMGSGVKNLSSEKVRVSASEIIDQGNRIADAVSRLRLRNIPSTKISFQNSVVAAYTNATCTVDSCKIFTYDGGGLDWETPPPNVNGAEDWAYTGDLAIENIGTGDADLVALLPNINNDVCVRINVDLGIHAATASPPVIATVTASKFIGPYNAAPIAISDPLLSQQKSGCLQATALAGSAVTAAANAYVYYQVLIAR